MRRALRWFWKTGMLSTFLAGLFAVLPIVITVGIMAWFGGLITGGSARKASWATACADWDFDWLPIRSWRPSWGGLPSCWPSGSWPRAEIGREKKARDAV